MKKYLLLTVLVATSAHANCDHMFPYGKPKTKLSEVELCRSGYAVIYDTKKRIPSVTYEYLTPETIGRGQSVRTPFIVDRDLKPSDRSRPDDYAGNGVYDRGHLAAAQNAKDDRAMVDTMLMSNIVPQVSSFNRGSWKILESHIAKDVRRGKTLYVITGVVSTGELVMNRKVVVPEYMYKIIVDKSKGTVTSYIMPNETNNRSYKSFKVSYHSLVKFAGIELLPELKND